MTGADVSAPAGAPGRPRPPRRTRYPRCPQSRRFHGMWAKLERERTAGPSRRPVLRRARLGRDRSRSLDCGHHADLTDLGTLAGRGRSRQATSGRSRSTARPAASPTSQGRWVSPPLQDGLGRSVRREACAWDPRWCPVDQTGFAERPGPVTGAPRRLPRTRAQPGLVTSATRAARSPSSCEASRWKLAPRAPAPIATVCSPEMVASATTGQDFDEPKGVMAPRS